jgi:formate dehydrogenase (NADP+) alpha subunit
MSKKLTITIDGKEYEFNKGDTILDVAKKAGIYIPTLCIVDGLKPFGGCRLCTVKVVGDRKPFQSACSSPAMPGSTIITKDDELQEMRKDILQMRLSEHPSNCLVCGHGEVCDDLESHPDAKPTQRIFGCFSCSSKEICELRQIVEYLEINELSYDFEYKNFPVEKNDPFFERDFNLCIFCGKCVRVCDELRGIHAIDFMKRGHEAHVATANHIPLIESNCQFCGSCIDICPTGVSTPHKSKWVRKKDNVVSSICGLCSVGCGLDLYYEDYNLIEAVPKKENEINKGQACVLGRFCIPEVVHGENRLLEPQLKKKGKLVSTSWEEAYSSIRENMGKFKAEEIGVLASPDLSNESAFILNEIASKVLKTSNIATLTDGNAMAYDKILTALPRSFEKINTSEWILLVGSNIQVSHQVLMINLVKAKKNGAKIVSLALEDLNLDDETSNLLDENKVLSEKDLINALKEYGKGIGTILMGQNVTYDVAVSLTNLAVKNKEIALIPLRSRANLDGVFNYIPNSEAGLLKDLEAGKIKALYTTERLDEKLLSKVEFLIVQDIYPSSTSEKADVILPTTSYVETSGTFTNAELVSQHFDAAIEPIGNTKPDWQIISEIAEKLDRSSADSFNFESITALTKKVPVIKPSSLKDIKDSKGKGSEKQAIQKISLEGFKYRGEPIANLVSDLQRIIDFKKNNGEKLPEKKNSDEKSVIDLNINLNGAIVVGDSVYGLDAIKPILKAINASGNSARIILESSNQNFVYIHSDQYCLCNNYKNNLQESNLLADLSNGICETLIPIKNEAGEMVLTPVEGVILVSRELIEASKSKLDEIRDKKYPNDSQQPGMQTRAFEAGQASALNPTSYVVEPLEIVDDGCIQNPEWNAWGHQRLVVDENSDELSGASERKIVKIDKFKCMGCGKCEEVCPHDAITMLEFTKSMGIFLDKPIRVSDIDPAKCHKCAICVGECPINAISIKKW